MKYVLGALAILSLISSSGLFGLYWHLSQFPYNSEGRYFDEEAAVVHHVQTVEVTFMLAILFAGIFIVSLVLLRRIISK